MCHVASTFPCMSTLRTSSRRATVEKGRRSDFFDSEAYAKVKITSTRPHQLQCGHLGATSKPF